MVIAYMALGVSLLLAVCISFCVAMTNAREAKRRCEEHPPCNLGSCFHFMVDSLHHCGPCMERSIMAASACGRATLPTSWHAGSRERKTGRGFSKLPPSGRHPTWSVPGYWHMGYLCFRSPLTYWSVVSAVFTGLYYLIYLPTLPYLRIHSRFIFIVYKILSCEILNHERRCKLLTRNFVYS